MHGQKVKILACLLGRGSAICRFSTLAICTLRFAASSSSPTNCALSTLSLSSFTSFSIRSASTCYLRYDCIWGLWYSTIRFYHTYQYLRFWPIWQLFEKRMYLPIYLCMYLSTYLPIYLSTYLPIYLSTYLPMYLPYLSTYVSTYLPIYLSTYLPI